MVNILDHDDELNVATLQTLPSGRVVAVLEDGLILFPGAYMVVTEETARAIRESEERAS